MIAFLPPFLHHLDLMSNNLHTQQVGGWGRHLSLTRGSRGNVQVSAIPALGRGLERKEHD